MKAKNAKVAAQLCEALSELPLVRRALSDKPVKGRVLTYDCIHLEMQASEMMDGEGQGSSHYFHVPANIGRLILDEADKIIRAELKSLGVDVPRRANQ